MKLLIKMHIQQLEKDIRKLKNGKKFLKDMNDTRVEYLGLRENYDGLTVNVKKIGCKEHIYLVSGEDDLYYTSPYWELTTVNLVNLKHFVVESRFGSEMDLSKMKFPYFINKIQVPNFFNIPEELINKLPDVTISYCNYESDIKTINSYEDYNTQKLCEEMDGAE